MRIIIKFTNKLEQQIVFLSSLNRSIRRKLAWITGLLHLQA